MSVDCTTKGPPIIICCCRRVGYKRLIEMISIHQYEAVMVIHTEKMAELMCGSIAQVAIVPPPSVRTPQMAACYAVGPISHRPIRDLNDILSACVSCFAFTPFYLNVHCRTNSVSYAVLLVASAPNLFNASLDCVFCFF